MVLPLGSATWISNTKSRAPPAVPVSGGGLTVATAKTRWVNVGGAAEMSKAFEVAAESPAAVASNV